MSVEFELYLRTPMDPQQIITQLREELGASGPITIFLWRCGHDDIPIYDLVIPLEGQDEEAPAHIIVSVFETPPLLLKSVTEYFDLLGMQGHEQSFVEVEFKCRPSDISYQEGWLQVLPVISYLLLLIDGDCIARLEGLSMCKFIRKHGEVIIDPSVGIWSDAEKQALGFSFITDKLPPLP